MLRSKSTVFVTIFALLLMTGAFTALSADRSNGPAMAADIDEFALVNGDEVVESDFRSRVASIEQNLLALNGDSDDPFDDPMIPPDVMEIIRATSPETIALASLIVDMAIFQEAAERGHLPDEEQVAQQVEQERRLFEMIEENPEQLGFDPADVERYRETIEETGGDDVYWNEFFPQVIEQQQAVQQFQIASAEAGENWTEIQREAFESAEVQIRDPESIAPATVADARMYLESVWNVQQR
jgi:parvulin-like peptidyl-prolyl isomerase